MKTDDSNQFAPFQANVQLHALSFQNMYMSFTVTEV